MQAAEATMAVDSEGNWHQLSELVMPLSSFTDALMISCFVSEAKSCQVHEGDHLDMAAH